MNIAQAINDGDTTFFPLHLYINTISRPNNINKI